MANDVTCPYNSSANSSFPSKEYLKRFSDPTIDPMQVHVKFLKAWHDFYEKYLGKMEKPVHLLEFGGGPTIHSLITAAKHVETVTFADYAASNRNEIVMWKGKIEGCKSGCGWMGQELPCRFHFINLMRQGTIDQIF